jgi:hypothetical protein
MRLRSLGSMLAATMMFACAPLGISSARDAPTPPTAASHIINTQHYSLTIDYAYKGRVFHTTWNELCFLYRNDSHNPATYETRARWRGVATTLPDGSAAYFQMRSDICANGQLSRLVFGPDGYLALWRNFANEPGPPRPSNAAADRDPSAYTTPVIYWLDHAKRPSRVELCIMPACGTKSDARVRVLGLHGAAIDSTGTSNPVVAVPALDSLTKGENRFVGYACWRIPFDEARQLLDLRGWSLEHWAISTPGNGTSGMAGPDGAVYQMTQLVDARLPLANSWASAGEGFNSMDPAYNSVQEWQLEPAAARARLSTPMNAWRRGCRRDGDVMKFDSAPAPPDTPIIMTLLPKSALSPTQIQIPGGLTLNAGTKSSISTDSEPTRFTSNAYSEDRTSYIAEAIVFSVNYPQPWFFLH